jgi:hypothetical protein
VAYIFIEEVKLFTRCPDKVTGWMTKEPTFDSKDSHPYIQTGPRAQPASYTMEARGSFADENILSE